LPSSAYLNADGRLLICFGSSGDIVFLYELIEKAKFKKEVIAHRELAKDGLNIDCYTFLLNRVVTKAYYKRIQLISRTGAQI